MRTVPDKSTLNDFVACYNPKNRHERKESERFKSFTYEDLLKRDKLNLDIFWLKDESLEDRAAAVAGVIRYWLSVVAAKAALAQLTLSLPRSFALSGSPIYIAAPQRAPFAAIGAELKG